MKRSVFILLFFPFLFFTIKIQAQEQKVEKSTYVVGLGLFERTYSNIFKTEYFKGGTLIIGEARIPTKLVKNIRYVFGGTYFFGEDFNPYNASNMDLKGGGVYSGLNASIPFVDGNFKFGIFIQPVIGYYNFLYMEGSVTNNYAGLGSTLKGGLFIKYKGISISPLGFYQMIGSQKADKTLIGSGGGIELGLDF